MAVTATLMAGDGPIRWERRNVVSYLRGPYNFAFYRRHNEPYRWSAATDFAHGKAHDVPQITPLGWAMMNMPEEMKQRLPMMMQTEISPADPAAILSITDDLKLTPDQVQRLQAIRNTAHQEALAVLDDTQAKMVRSIPAMPATSMGMHQHMMRMMRQMHGHDGQDGTSGKQMPMMNCPMMNMTNSPTAQPSQNKTPQGEGMQH